MTGTELQKAPAAAAEPPAGPVFAPRVDVGETDEAFVIHADLPGVRPGDVALCCKDGELTLDARCGPRPPAGRPLYAEYAVGDFRRTFLLPAEVDAAGIEATLAAGVLTVRVPKAETVRPKRIQVKAG